MASKLTFLGTKGEIEQSSEKHGYHSSLLLLAGRSKVLIDYGELHKYSLEELAPEVILITHTYPDHYLWLNEEIQTDIPVYLTREALSYGKYRLAKVKVIKPGELFSLDDIQCLPIR